MIDTAALLQEVKSLGLTLDETALSRFDRYAEMLVETNRQFNLTAIKEPAEIAVKHFADSLSLLAALEIPEGAALLDIGTGAGFPGVPLLIARPDLKITMVDSTGKKLNFVREVLSDLNLNAAVIHGRAEELGRGELRESFDVVTSRAVAALNVLCEYCLPFVKVQGTFAAMKGAKGSEELALCRTAIPTLGGKYGTTKAFTLSDGAERNIILIQKISQTPPKYPRVSAQIAKKAL